MSDPWLPWVALQPSRLQRRLMALALLTSTMTAVSLLVAALQAPAATRVAAVAAAAAAVWAAFRAWRPSARQRPSLRIESDGRIAVRQSDGTATAEPLFVSSWLIALRSAPRRVVPVWHDALDQSGFRRLAAAARWRTQRRSEPERIADGMA